MSVQTISNKLPLFDYWNTIPVVVLIKEKYYFAVEQEIRAIILETLRVGIDDIHPKTKKTVRRHVLNAEELFKIVKSKLNRRIKIQTIFFHLNFLKQQGNLVSEVYQIKGTRQMVRYFSRIGKYYIFYNYERFEQYKEDNLEEISAVKKYVKILHPNKSQIEIDNLVDKAGSAEFQTIVRRRNELKTWIEDHIDLLESNLIDHRYVTNYLIKNIPACKPLTSEFQKVFELLHFKL